jgi:hypothetical protein
MRTSDKKKNMQKANLLAESLYRQRNNENFDYAGEERAYHDKMNYDSQEQPKMDDDEQMYYYISKYVKDPDDIEMELSNYRSMGYQGLSDYVKANLSRDIDFMTYVQMGHDEETFRRETNNEDFDYAAAEREYHDKQDYENMSVEEFVGTPVSLNRKLVNIHTSEPDLPIQGVFAGIDRSEGVPMMVIEKNGKKVGYIFYEKDKDRFIEGMSSWLYVFEPMDADTADLLKRFAKLS